MSNSFSFVDLCAGIGGLKAGLISAAWKCALSVDNNIDAVKLHRFVFRDCKLEDVTLLNSEDVPSTDFLVAGFPCQPFSSSGNKLGFNHKSGNVFEHILRIIDNVNFKYLLFENVEGLLRNQQGYTFANVLKFLNERGYDVQWCSFDANQLGVAQTRSRLFIFAYKKELISRYINHQRDASDCFYRSYIELNSLEPKFYNSGDLDSVIKDKEPAIGKAASTSKLPFSLCGFSSQKKFISWKFSTKVIEYPETLGSICCPDFDGYEGIKSVRFYARGGPTTPHFRKEKVAHCLGGTIGAAPTFAVSLDAIDNDLQRTQVLARSNWHREQNGHLIFRLTPIAALNLFGEKIKVFSKAFESPEVSNTNKYIILGNMVSPDVSSFVGEALNDYIAREVNPI